MKSAYAEPTISFFGALLLLVICHLLFGTADPMMPINLGPPETLINVTWNGEPHVINQKTAAGVPFAPDRIKFGNPFVRSSVGNMRGIVLELDPSHTEVMSKTPGLNYEQLEFGVGEKANGYCISCDFVIAPREFEGRRDVLSFFLDGRATTKLVFDARGAIRYFDYPFIESDLGVYSVNKVVTLEVLMDFVNGRVIFMIDGKRFDFPLMRFFERDLTGIRISFSDPTDTLGRAAIDNFKVIALGKSKRVGKIW